MRMYQPWDSCITPLARFPQCCYIIVVVAATADDRLGSVFALQKRWDVLFALVNGEDDFDHWKQVSTIRG